MPSGEPEINSLQTRVEGRGRVLSAKDVKLPDDFQTANVNELLYGDAAPVESEDDKAYRVLLERDRKLVSGFAKRNEGLKWPEPVRKRHIR